MDETDGPVADRVVDLLEAGRPDEASARLEAVREAPADARKETLRSLEAVAGDRPQVLEPVVGDLAEFLTDDEQSVRLTAAKALVVSAEATPGAVRPVVPSLVDRLADDGELYFVRGRCAEAIGYVALEHPDAVASPEVLAEFRVGLSFDEPEVREKLAKALACVALAAPSRLRHQVGRLAEHLDDGTELVRYHLTTALVGVGCEHPDRLDATAEALTARLDDETAEVRGRAAEALGLLGRATDAPDLPVQRLDALRDDGEPSFVRERARFALAAVEGGAAEPPAGIGTTDGVRATTDDAVDAITTPDGDACAHCGQPLPPDGPPMCPQCGTPR